MQEIIRVKHLKHKFSKRIIYEDLNFSVKEGSVFGILGRNGVGKSTLINILTGFLEPTSGLCEIFGENSHKISPATRAKIGLLYEGHLVYDFLTIKQIESFYAPFYKNWKKNVFYELVDLLGLPLDHKIKNMSYGQRAQIVLGLIFAQDPDLLILDDYSLGLDAGYRRLFLDFLKDFIKLGNKTAVVTSHIVNDLENVVDEIFILERGGAYLDTNLQDLLNDFKCYGFSHTQKNIKTLQEKLFNKAEFKSFEVSNNFCKIYTHMSLQEAQNALLELNLNAKIEQISMRLEDAFVGYTGRN